MFTHWNCAVCKSYNDILNTYCCVCKLSKPFVITNEIQLLTEIKRSIYFLRLGIWDTGLNMTEQEELFAKFYNEEKVLVMDMDAPTLREHRDILSKIAFEAKAKLGAVDDVQRERNAKTKNKEFILTDASVRQTDSDALNAPKIRAARMNKIDKMRADLEKLGYLDDETINEMIRKMEKKGTETVVNQASNAFKKVAASPVEKQIEAAKVDGTITDAAPIEKPENPFAKFKKVS